MNQNTLFCILVCIIIGCGSKRADERQKNFDDILREDVTQKEDVSIVPSDSLRALLAFLSDTLHKNKFIEQKIYFGVRKERSFLVMDDIYDYRYTIFYNVPGVLRIIYYRKNTLEESASEIVDYNCDLEADYGMKGFDTLNSESKFFMSEKMSGEDQKGSAENQAFWQTSYQYQIKKLMAFYGITL